MPDISYLINEYVKSELLVLIPVLYIITKFLGDISLGKKQISAIILTISILLSGIYTFATTDIQNWQSALLAAFSSLVQGILLSGSAFLGNSMVKNIKSKCANSKKCKDSTTDDSSK